MNRRLLRKFKNAAFLSLSLVATMTGLACLAAILWTLLSHGLAGMSWHVFSQMTPPPGAKGGLLNAIYGSAVMTLLGMLIGSPIGLLAGTYLAEYGRSSRLSTASLCPNRDAIPSRHPRNRMLQQTRHGKHSGRALNVKRQL